MCCFKLNYIWGRNTINFYYLGPLKFNSVLIEGVIASSVGTLGGRDTSLLPQKKVKEIVGGPNATWGIVSYLISFPTSPCSLQLSVSRIC